MMLKRVFFLVPLLLLQALVVQQPLPGDINNDGKVDSTDVARGVQIALGKPPPATQAELAAGDMNRDGRITVQDLVFIRNTIAGANIPPVADASASPDSGLAGTDIQLDATNSFDLDGDTLSYCWRQLHMNRYSTEYITENKAVLSDSTNVTPIFNPVWPGNYRFELQVAEAAGLANRDTVDVWVRKASVRQLDFKGVLFGDLFGDFIGPPKYNLSPDEPDSQAVVLSRAMQGAIRSRAGWVAIIPMAFYTRINPLPEIRHPESSGFLSRESDYAAIVAAAKANGLKVLHHQGLDFGSTLRPGEADSLELLMNSSPEWWTQWYNEYQALLVTMAKWAQKYDVEMIDLFTYVEDTFKPNVFPNYAKKWRAIITAVSQEFNGKISVNMINTTGLDFADALDVVRVTVFSGEYLDRLSDFRNPTLTAVKTISESIFDMHELNLGGQLPVYIDFVASSSDGQVPDEPVLLPPSERDFREQVIYYEGIFQALEDENWISGVNVTMWNWFDELDFPGLYFDEFVGMSTRSKPAEKAIKLWFGIY